MDDVLEQLDVLRRTERRVAMATLVAAKGTTPKKEGAKMWVGEGGRILGSVTIGGCVDARVIEEAERALSKGQRVLLTLSLGDDDAWEIGLTCGGTVDVLVEPIDLTGDGDVALRAYETARAEIALGRGAVIVTPLDAGDGRLVVREDGSSDGTLGSAALDASALREAAALLRSGASAVRTRRCGAPTVAGTGRSSGTPCRSRAAPAPPCRAVRRPARCCRGSVAAARPGSSARWTCRNRTARAAP